MNFKPSQPVPYWIFQSVYAIAAIFVFHISVFAQTNISGNIPFDTLTVAGSPYIIGYEGVSVPTGDTLYVEPGVEIRSNGVNINNNWELDVFGTLIGIGTSTDSITFTNHKNGLRGAFLRFQAGSSGEIAYWKIDSMETGIFLYSSDVIIRNSSITACKDDGIRLNQAINPTIEDNYIADVPFGDGIDIGSANSSPLIKGNIIQNCNTGLSANIKCSPKIEDNTIVSNNTNFSVHPMSLSLFKNNSSDGIIRINSGGIDSACVFPSNALTPETIISTISSADLNINLGGELVIEEGVTLLLAHEKSDIYVHGTFICEGTEQNRITVKNGTPGEKAGNIFLLTGSTADLSYTDFDSLGSSPTGENSSTQRGAFRIYSSIIIMDSCSIRDAHVTGITVDAGNPVISNTVFDNAPLIISNGSPSIDSCTFMNTNTAISSTNKNSRPIITNNQFVNISNYNISLHPMSLGALQNNYTSKVHLNSSAIDGYCVFPNDIMASNTIISTISSADLNIDLGGELVIEEGVTLLLNEDKSDIYVNGTFRCEGTEQNRITIKNGTPGEKAGNIFLQGGSTANLYYTDFDSLGSSPVGENSSTQRGAFRIHSSNVIIDHCSISDSHLAGITVDNGSATISRTVFDNAHCTMLSGSSPNIDSCEFLNCLVGLDMGSSNITPSITNNIFHDNTNADIEISPKYLHLLENNTVSCVKVFGGSISENTHLSSKSLIDSTEYKFSDNCVLDSGIVLTIASGAQILIKEDKDVEINGSLQAIGNRDNPITFRNYSNDEYGGQLKFGSLSVNNILDNVVFDSIGTVVVRSLSFDMKNSKFRNVQYRSIEIKDDATPNFHNVELRGRPAVVLETGSNPTFLSCLILNEVNNFPIVHASGNAIGLFRNCTFENRNPFPSNPSAIYRPTWNTGIIDARFCWWSHNTGPYHPNLNPNGQGLEVSDRVWFNPWLRSDIKDIQLGVNTLDTLSVTPRYYRLEIPDSLADESVLLTIKSSSTQGRNELYASYSELPSRGQSQLIGTVLEDSLFLIIPETDSGAYYFFLYPEGIDTQAVTIFAQVQPHSLNTVEPNFGQKTGGTTVKINGFKFTENESVLLVSSQDTILAYSSQYVNPTQIFTTFDLREAVLGTYDIWVFNQNDTSIMTNAFEVKEGLIIPGIIGNGSSQGGVSGSSSCVSVSYDEDAALEINVEAPEFSRAIWPAATIYIHYKNISGADIPVPRRIFVSERNLSMSLDIDKISEGKPFLALELKEPGGPEGILRAGAEGTITIYAQICCTVNEFKLLK